VRALNQTTNATRLPAQALPKEFTEPPEVPYTPRPDLESWLSDPAGREQFVIRHAVGGAEETSVYWGETGRPASLSYGGEREKDLGLSWCDLEVKWSPVGSYLATFHSRGVALWGGANMEKQGR
jgi:translation initiation factor 3 subunit B